MESGFTPRSSSPAALAGFLVVVIVVLWGLYGLWIRNAYLRPATQTTAAAGHSSCMDRYSAGSAPADDKAAQLNLLWSIYYLCTR